MKKKIVMFAFILSLNALNISCGVKADPQPPLTPAEIGHGRPLYKNEEDSTPLQRKALPEDEQKNDQDSDENQ